MPDGWAASGARLSLPLEIEFLEDPLIEPGTSLPSLLLTPGEPMLGNQFEIKKLKCTGGSFVGEQGEQYVEATGGAWSAQEPGRCSQRVLRFYIDFPQGAARNDVTLPAGRVFFNTAMGESEEMRASQRLKAGVESELEALRSEQAATRAAEESGMGLVDQANALRKAVKRAERYEGETLPPSWQSTTQLGAPTVGWRGSARTRQRCTQQR